MRKLNARQIRRIRQLRHAQGMTTVQVREKTGHTLKVISKYAPGSTRKIDVAPIREAVEVAIQETDLTYTGLAVLLWGPRTDASGKPRGGQTTRLQRRLGIKPQGGVYSKSIDYQLAMRILRAAGRDPIDAGY